MRRLLDLLRGRAASEAPAAAPPLAPEEPVAVIGDVHGCDALLAQVLDCLDRVAPGHRPVLVGDLIDRGEDSAQVLRRLMAHPDAVALRGNHEDMLLRFLEEPKRTGRAWLRNGGLQTLASFGIGGLGLGAGGEALHDAAGRLRDAMGEEMVGWLRGRPLTFRSGNLVVVHAALDPRRPVGEQDEQVMLWGHPRFETEPRTDGIWVAHGHVIRPEPLAAAGRIAVDTGAFATGRLTAALIRPGGGEFVQT